MKAGVKMSEKTAKKTTILALDLGGSKMLSALVDVFESADGGRSVELRGVARRALTKDSGRDGVWRAILDATAETFERTGESWANVASIGATIPGVADPKRGYWVYAPFSGIADFPLADELRAQFGKPVFADNDVNACAWAEKVFGACQEVDNFVWITISNGIGGGLVLDGKVYAGKFSGAAEIGHFNVVENGGALCGCGNRGCLEATAAGPGIARRYRELVKDVFDGIDAASSELRVDWLRYLASTNANANAELALAQSATAADVADEARRGNPLAVKVYNDTGRYVGRAASYAANLVNPEKIVIGGGVAGAFDLFYPALWETFERCLFKATNKTLTIEKTRLGYEAGLMGAASLAFSPYC